MKKEASYIPNKMIVTSIRGLSADTKALDLRFAEEEVADDFTFQPGQFVSLSLPGYGEAVLSLTNSVEELPTVSVAVRSIGNITRAIHRLKVGDQIDLRGPYGQGFPFAEAAGREVLIVAGGIGLAPLRCLIHQFKDQKIQTSSVKIFIGSKTPEDLIYKHEYKSWEEFAEVLYCVNTPDADWKGHVGFVTDLLSKTKIDKDAVAVLCGPPVMYTPVIAELKKVGVAEDQVFVFLERRMKCGIGKCQHCTCGDKYVCLDGPIFRYSELKDNWEAFV
jgi:NAD(P)H-flavin reductase